MNSLIHPRQNDMIGSSEYRVIMRQVQAESAT